MSESRIQWKQQAEKLLISLRDILGAGITMDDDGEITEINILAEGNRPPKQIVRDVRSALRAEYQIDLDYRRISVAQKTTQGGPAEEPRVLTLPASRVREEPPNVRLRLRELSTTMSDNVRTVRIELSMGKTDVVGEAFGTATKHNMPRLVSEATLQAVERFLDDGYQLSLMGIDIQRFSGEEIVLVAVKFLQERGEKALTGTCVVNHDMEQSIVYATLDALNRILGRLEYREPVEFELRPTSAL